MSHKGNPDCCCTEAETCIVFVDPFDRADSGTVGNGWTQISGTSGIDGETLLLTGADAAVVWPNGLTGNFAIWITFDLLVDTNGDWLRFHTDEEPDGSYEELAIEFDGGDAIFRLRKISTGPITEEQRICVVPAALNVVHTLSIRMHSEYGGGLHCVVVFNDENLIGTGFFYVSPVVAGTTSKIITGSSNTGTILIDNFVMNGAYASPDYEMCPRLKSCTFPIYPDTVPVVTLDVDSLMLLDFGGAPADITALNGTYNLTHDTGCDYSLTGLSLVTDLGTVTSVKLARVPFTIYDNLEVLFLGTGFEIKFVSFHAVPSALTNCKSNAAQDATFAEINGFPSTTSGSIVLSH